MKKISVIGILLIAIVSISTASLAMSMDMTLDKTKDIKMNDTVIYTLKLSEKMIGASFKINYDSDQLELVESGTTNLSVSNNNGKIACVYFDMAKTGIDTCSVKFKAKKNIENTTLTFELEEAKFITLNGEKSYSQSDIAGIKKTITIEKSSASSSGNTGSTDGNPSNSDNSGSNNNNNGSNSSGNNNNTNNNLNNSNNASGNTNNSNSSNNVSGNTNNSNSSNNISGNTNNSNNLNNMSSNTNNINNANNKNSSKTNTANQSSASNSSKSDSTLANSKLPKTGLNHYILIPICLVSMLAVYFFVKMKLGRE